MTAKSTIKERFKEVVTHLPETKAAEAAGIALVSAKEKALKPFMTEMLEKLPGALEKGTSATLEWLDEYFGLFNIMGDDIVASLEKAGYSKEDSRKYSSSKDKDEYGRHIIGSLLESRQYSEYCASHWKENGAIKLRFFHSRMPSQPTADSACTPA